MANKNTIEVTLKAMGDFNDVLTNVKQVQSSLNSLKMPDQLKGRFIQLFNDIQKRVQNASDIFNAGFTKKSDLTKFNTEMRQAQGLLVGLQKEMQHMPKDVLKDSFKIDPNALKDVEDQIRKIKSELTENISNNNGIAKALQELENTKRGGKTAGILKEALDIGDIEKAEKAINRLLGTIKSAQSRSGFEGSLEDFVTANKDKYEAFYQSLMTLRGELDKTKTSAGNLDDTIKKLKELNGAKEDINAAEFGKFVDEFEKLTGINLTELINGTRNLGENTAKAGENAINLNKTLDNFKNKAAYFFGIDNAVRLLRRSLQAAFETVKDLDAVMTETAVVTDFSVGDMWSQLPEYTERANQLGVSIHDAYEAATIYYQQGLKTNEVMAVSNETLKMARIASLDAAEATDRMTNALRGFNMEINTENSQRVADVYSKLAAISASNVDEISTAMTKVASLANNANMEFETTAAFLSQIVETTRESAETAGTALKTVIARFSEVKELYNTGDLLGTDEEGNEIDVNKVSSALRTAGIDLNEYLTGAKGLDDIFLELASKWDGLDQVQQRYIATMAAGSRQQSRFIAMMQDYGRTMELVDAANNAAGASQQQYEKTLDSLESKLNQLKNSWDNFTMGLANSDIIKTVVDLLKGLLDIVNGITDTFGSSGGAIAKIVALAGAFALIKSKSGVFFEELVKQLGAFKFWKKGADEAKQAADDLGDAQKETAEDAKELTEEEEAAAAAEKAAAAAADESRKKIAAYSAALMGVSMLLGGLSKTFEKTNKKTSQFLSTLSKGAMATAAALQIIPPILKSLEISIPGIGGIVALVGAAISLGKAFYDANDKVKQATNQLEAAKEAADKAKESFENISSSLDSIRSQQDALKDMTAGTIEWRDAVESLNSKVLELLSSFPELAQYANFAEDGTITLDIDSKEVQDTLEKYQKDSQIATINESMAQSQLNQEKANKTVGKFTYRDVYDETIGNVRTETLSEDKIKKLARYFAGDIDALSEEERDGATTKEDVASKLGLTLSEDEIDDLTQVGKDLIAAETQNSVNAKALISTIDKFDDNVDFSEDFTDAASKLFTPEVVGKFRDEEGNLDTDKLTEALTKTEELLGDTNLNTLTSTEGIKISDIASALKVSDDKVKEILDQIAALNLERQKYFSKVFEGFVKPSEGIEKTEGFENFGYDVYEALAKSLETFAAGGGNAKGLFNNIQNILTSSTEKLTEEQRESFVKAFNSTDWRDIDAINDFQDRLSELGIEINKDDSVWKSFVLRINEGAHAIEKINLNNFLKGLGGLGKILGEIESGKKTDFTADEYSQISAVAPDLADQFVLNAEGNYSYLGGRMDELAEAIRANTTAQYETLKGQLESKIGAGETLQGTSIAEVNVESDSEFNKRASLTRAIRDLRGSGVNLDELGIQGLTNDTNAADPNQVSAEMVDAIITGLQGVIIQLPENQQSLTNLNTQQAINSNTAAQNAGLAANTENRNALYGQALGAGVDPKVYDELRASIEAATSAEQIRLAQQLASITQTYQEAQALGYDTEQLSTFAQQLQLTYGVSAEAAAAAALGNMKLNEGLGEIMDSYETWTGLIDESTGKLKIETSEDAKAFSDLQKSANKMLNTSKDLSDEFWDNAENIKNLKKAAEGDTEALEDLQKAASKDYLVNLDLDLATDEGKQAVEDFANYLDSVDLPTLEAGVQWDDSGAQEFISRFNDMAAAANLTADQIQESVRAMGFDAEIDWVEDDRKVPNVVTETIIDDHFPPEEGGGISKSHTITYTDGYTIAHGEFPVVKTLTSTGSGGGGVSYGNKSKGASNKGGKTGGGGGGGGGGSEKKETWDNPYDELYNLTEKINEALRQREKLEREYDRMLDHRVATGKKLQENSLAELKNLREEIALQEEYARRRLNQINNIGSETHKDEEGNEKTFKEWGVTKYASYNAQTGLIQIDWDGIDAITDTELGGAVEAYISQMEEWVGDYEKTEETLEDMNDAVWEIEHRGIEDAIELQKTVYDLLVEERERQIEALQEVNDSINDSNSRMIDAIRESIDLERQIRDNTKTEEDIADKEAQLAYLQRDTSGANDLEILKLQQEIDDARQNYTDTLIDQAIDRMATDNEKAAQQREDQITIMQEQLRDYQESRRIWEDVDQIIRNGMTSDGELAVGSRLDKLFTNSDDFKSSSWLDQKDKLTTFSNLIAEAWLGFSNDKMDDAKKEGSVPTAYGTLTYKDGKWLDANGREYVVTYDVSSGTYRAVPVAVEPKEEEKKKETTNTNTNNNSNNSGSGSKSNSGSGSNKSGSTTKNYPAKGTLLDTWYERIDAMWHKETKVYANGKGGTYTDSQTKRHSPKKGYCQKCHTYNNNNNNNNSNRSGGSTIKVNEVYASGGLNKKTGPAWLDGTPSKPELVLNAKDTQNFLALKDILAEANLNSTLLGAGGDNYYNIEISVDEISNDYDVDRLAERVKKQITDDATYRNVNAIRYIR